MKRSWMNPSPGIRKESDGKRAKDEHRPAWMAPSPGSLCVQNPSTASEKSHLRRQLHLDMATVWIAGATVDEVVSKFARDGADAGRVAKVLSNPCKCSFHCRRNLNANRTAVQEFCSRYHGLKPDQQQHMLEVCYKAIIFNSGGRLCKAY